MYMALINNFYLVTAFRHACLCQQCRTGRLAYIPQELHFLRIFRTCSECIGIVTLAMHILYCIYHNLHINTYSCIRYNY